MVAASTAVGREPRLLPHMMHCPDWVLRALQLGQMVRGNEGVQRYGAQVPGESRTPTPWILDDCGEQGAQRPSRAVPCGRTAAE